MGQLPLCGIIQPGVSGLGPGKDTNLGQVIDLDDLNPSGSLLLDFCARKGLSVKCRVIHKCTRYETT